MVFKIDSEEITVKIMKTLAIKFYITRLQGFGPQGEVNLEIKILKRKRTCICLPWETECKMLKPRLRAAPDPLLAST